ncbi:acyl-CoA thioesterase [Paracoccus sp. (in: a-proteobacteria)]|uniref:acyl-CoA thioesterase n=1 Tax=Paracoccus sp. TaxID=267 RepID=UPI0026DFF744|nr:acyl-CoA thioesterase [Paracoccus sp. (in: a-proteobacteria)]MDO5368892.1 acyl-CoA thioesterase [Paracoccus sp. (in: a-proteobacteria)]
MYPILRFLGEVASARRAPRLGPLEPHVSTHRISLLDLDPWRELNNGRTLTIYDLGRIPMAIRLGITDTLKKNGWGFTVAGNTVRYRRRIRAFQRITQVSRVIGWDDRFVYMEQSMWAKGDCLNHMLLRVAIVGGAARRGMIAPSEFMAAMGHDAPSPPLPGWVAAWIEADARRPWPPVLPPMTDRTDDLPA